jgi:hypothetical protein
MDENMTHLLDTHINMDSVSAPSPVEIVLLLACSQAVKALQPATAA